MLVVSDDRRLAAGLAGGLASAGYEVEEARGGEDAVRRERTFRPDLAVVDARPAGPAALALGGRLRGAGDLPLVYLVASPTGGEALAAFEAGADDCVGHPPSPAIVAARVGAVLRRSGRRTAGALRVRDLVVDEAGAGAYRAGSPVGLTPTELRLLATMAASPGRVFSKTALLSEVWGFAQFSPNLVEVHMSALRRKLEAHGPRLVHTVRGTGYVLRP